MVVVVDGAVRRADNVGDGRKWIARAPLENDSIHGGNGPLVTKARERAVVKLHYHAV